MPGRTGTKNTTRDRKRKSRQTNKKRGVQLGGDGNNDGAHPVAHPVNSKSATRANADAAAGATPPATGPIPPATGATPAATGATPPATGATPAATGATPPATGATPAATGATPPATGATPAATGATPAATGPTPPATGPTPAANAATPTADPQPAPPPLPSLAPYKCVIFGSEYFYLENLKPDSIASSPGILNRTDFHDRFDINESTVAKYWRTITNRINGNPISEPTKNHLRFPCNKDDKEKLKVAFKHYESFIKNKIDKYNKTDPFEKGTLETILTKIQTYLKLIDTDSKDCIKESEIELNDDTGDISGKTPLDPLYYPVLPLIFLLVYKQAKGEYTVDLKKLLENYPELPSDAMAYLEGLQRRQINNEPDNSRARSLAAFTTSLSAPTATPLNPENEYKLPRGVPLNNENQGINEYKDARGYVPPEDKPVAQQSKPLATETNTTYNPNLNDLHRLAYYAKRYSNENPDDKQAGINASKARMNAIQAITKKRKENPYNRSNKWDIEKEYSAAQEEIKLKDDRPASGGGMLDPIREQYHAWKNIFHNTLNQAGGSESEESTNLRFSPKTVGPILEEQESWDKMKTSYNNLSEKQKGLFDKLEPAPIHSVVEIFHTYIDENADKGALEEARNTVGLLTPEEADEAMEKDTSRFYQIVSAYSPVFSSLNPEWVPMMARADMIRVLTAPT